MSAPAKNPPYYRQPRTCSDEHWNSLQQSQSVADAIVIDLVRAASIVADSAQPQQNGENSQWYDVPAESVQRLRRAIQALREWK